MGGISRRNIEIKKGIQVKKFIAILLMAGLSVCSVLAEDTEKTSLNYGIRLGADVYSVISDTEREIYPSHSGFGGEISFNMMYRVGQNLYLHPAVGVEYRDFRVYEEGNVSADCGWSCSSENWEGYDVNSFVYLDIPVMVQWQIPRILYFEVGAFVDVLLFAHEENVRPEKFRNERVFDDRRFGAGVAAGLGHEFSSGLFIDTRVSFQLTDLVDGDRRRLTDVREEFEMREENGEYHTTVIAHHEDYLGGDYYKLLKFQVGIGFWF